MSQLFILAYLLMVPMAPVASMAPWPQETPPKQEPPPKKDPPPKQEEPPNKAREAALAAIQGATNISDEKSRPVSPPSRPAATSTSNPGGRATTTRPSAATTTSSRTGGNTAANAAGHVHVTEAEKEVSRLFITNALFQAELAKRTEIISVDDVETPEAAMAELEAGNIRFMKGWRVRTLMAAQEPDLRATLEKGQSPFAVIVTCSDSRAMDNLIFDQELGRVFSIRVAGNSPDTLGIASIEYAVEHLGSKVVVIMGHTKCGAIGAVADAHGHPLPENMYIFQDLMKGLLDDVPRDPNESDADYKDRLEVENAKRQAQIVYDRSNIIREFVDEKKIWLLSASYDLHTGRVTFFNPVVGKPHGENNHDH